MDKKFNVRLKMFGSTNDELTNFESEWAGYAPMVDAVSLLRGQRSAIITKRESQESDIKGFATVKHNRRGAMADVAIKICGKVKAWSFAAGDMVIYQEMDITRSMIMNGQSLSAQTLCQSIYGRGFAMPNAAKAAYNVTPDDLLALQAAIDAYAEVVTTPRTAITGRKAETNSFKKMFTDCTITLKYTIDNLMQNFAGTEFFEKYFTARRVAQDATQKANLAVTVLSDYDGSPLVGALVHGTDGVTTFEEMTDTKGKIKRSEIHSDLWQLTITHVSYVGMSVEADIYPGDKEKVLVKLKPL